MKYTLPSGKASIEMSGCCMEKDYAYPLNKRDIANCLFESLEENHKQQRKIEELEKLIDVLFLELKGEQDADEVSIEDFKYNFISNKILCD